MALISVPHAARELGVTRMRVQQRIQDGSLPAQRVGRQWAIEEADLRAVAHHAGPGRPLSPASAWALLAVAAGADAHLSPSARSRARARLRRLLREAASSPDLDACAALVSRALGGRAQRQLYRASPLDLPGLGEDPRLRPSGLSAAAARISADGLLEGYVRDGELAALARDHLLTPAAGDRANVVIHLVDDQVDLDRPVGSDLLLAADLAEHDRPRERARAQELLVDLAERHAP